MKTLIPTLVALAVLGSAGSALAGSKLVSTVSIDVAGKRASGAIGSARASADTRQWIGCYSGAYADGSVMGFCGAVDANGLTRQCTIRDPKQLEEVRSLSSDGHISFRWNDSGLCTEVIVMHMSYWAPKAP